MRMQAWTKCGGYQDNQCGGAWNGSRHEFPFACEYIVPVMERALRGKLHGDLAGIGTSWGWEAESWAANHGKPSTVLIKRVSYRSRLSIPCRILLPASLRNSRHFQRA